MTSKFHQAAVDPPAASIGSRTVGPLLTLALAFALTWLADTPLYIPSPPHILLAAVVYSAFSMGMKSGLVSALIAVAHAAYFFSTPGEPFHYTDEQLRRVAVLAFTTPALAVMVGTLKRRAQLAAGERTARAEAEAHAAEASRLAEQLQGQAVELKQQVEEAQALAEELEEANQELRAAAVEVQEAREQTARSVELRRAALSDYECRGAPRITLPLSGLQPDAA